jgi:uncharacterized cysteine cluster protein YcgN (CxxCxxCC family)
MSYQSKYFNINSFFDKSLEKSGWTRDKFELALKNLENMNKKELQQLCEKIGNINDKKFFETEDERVLINYLIDDVDTKDLIRELGLS